MTSSYGCFARQTAKNSQKNEIIPLFFRAPNRRLSRISRRTRCRWLIIRCKKQQKQPDSPRGGEAQPSPPRKRGPRACPWLEQGTTGEGVALDSRLRAGLSGEIRHKPK